VARMIRDIALAVLIERRLVMALVGFGMPALVFGMAALHGGTAKNFAGERGSAAR